jgi:hypothetical protein
VQKLSILCQSNNILKRNLKKKKKHDTSALWFYKLLLFWLPLWGTVLLENL